VVDDSTVVLTERAPYECWTYRLGFTLDGDRLDLQVLDVDCPGEDPEEIEHMRMVFISSIGVASFSRID
jgi:hypothetical protein